MVGRYPDKYTNIGNGIGRSFPINLNLNFSDIGRDMQAVSGIIRENDEARKKDIEAFHERVDNLVVEASEKETMARDALIDKYGNKNTSLKSRLDIEQGKMEGLIDKDVFAKMTHGTYKKAMALAAIANEENPIPQVLGLANSQKASEYADRDSVGIYVSNRSTKPLVVATQGIIQYYSKSVQVTGVTIQDLDKVVEGMLIDTYHSPNRWTAIIDSVDVESQTIYVKDGWYMVQPGGSKSPSIPTSGTGFDISRITKIWGMNTNIFLYPDDTARQAVIGEFGIFNYTDKFEGAGGVDIVNFANKSKFGYKLRKSSITNAQGFENGYIAMDSENAFINFVNGGDESKILLRSLVDGSIARGYTVANDGTQTKQKLISMAFGNGQTSYGNGSPRILFLNKTVIEDFYIPTPTAKHGELIYIINASPSAAAILKNENGSGSFVSNGVASSSLTLPSKTGGLFVSDGAAWHSLTGGYFSKNGGLINGNVQVDSGETSGIDIGGTNSKLSYLDFHSSSTNSDFDARVEVTGGDSTPGNGEVNLKAKRFKINGSVIPTVKTGLGAPITSPDYIGQEYLDNEKRKVYKAFGNSSPADWIILN